MKTLTVNTSTGAEGSSGFHSWPIEISMPESLAEFTDLYGGEEKLVGALQAKFQQDSSQNNKSPVAKAAKAYGDAVDSENEEAIAKAKGELDAAVKKHQENVRNYKPGVRTPSDGLRITQKQRQSFGAAVAMLTVTNGGKAPTQKQLEEAAQELGFSLADLSAS